MARDWRLLREWMILAILLVLCDVITHSVLAADATGDQMTETAWWDEKDFRSSCVDRDSGFVSYCGGNILVGRLNIP